MNNGGSGNSGTFFLRNNISPDAIKRDFVAAGLSVREADALVNMFDQDFKSLTQGKKNRAKDPNLTLEEVEKAAAFCSDLSNKTTAQMADAFGYDYYPEEVPSFLEPYMDQCCQRGLKDGSQKYAEARRAGKSHDDALSESVEAAKDGAIKALPLLVRPAAKIAANIFFGDKEKKEMERQINDVIKDIRPSLTEPANSANSAVSATAQPQMQNYSIDNASAKKVVDFITKEPDPRHEKTTLLKRDDETLKHVKQILGDEVSVNRNTKFFTKEGKEGITIKLSESNLLESAYKLQKSGYDVKLEPKHQEVYKNYSKAMDENKTDEAKRIVTNFNSKNK